MSNLVRNESIKLFAGWANSISVTVIGAGAVGPFASKYLGLGTQLVGSDAMTNFAVVCICLGTALHLVGQIIIGGLVDD